MANYTKRVIGLVAHLSQFNDDELAAVKESCEMRQRTRAIVKARSAEDSAVRAHHNAEVRAGFDSIEKGEE